jgi:tRNA(Ile2) C34 agmatinyltransferase TiaS
MTAAIIAIGLGAIVVLLLGIRPSTKCPSCRKGLIEHALDDGALGLRCATCNMDYRRTDERQLVTVEAYDSGATEPPPEARLR